MGWSRYSCWASTGCFTLPPAPQYSPIVLAADGSVLHAYLESHAEMAD
ncbi:MAG: hypothetical protein WKG07_27615 [Hymenobacter sp.]